MASTKPKFVKVVYLTSPAIIYRCRSRTSLARVCFLNFILHRNVNYFICKLGYVRICLAAINKTLFSWLGQKTKRSMRCSHGHGMTPCPGKTSRYRSVFSILKKPLNIHIRFDSFSKFLGYSIRMKLQIRPFRISSFAKLPITCIFRFANL